MIKIELSKQIRQKHRNYYLDKIIPKLKQNINLKYTYNKANEAYNLKMDRELFEYKFIKQHSYFIKYVIKHAEQFAIGFPADLEKLDDFIKVQFPLVYRVIRNNVKNKDDISYRDYIYKIFGYENFEIKHLYDFFRLAAMRNRKKGSCTVEVREEIILLLKRYFPKKKADIDRSLNAYDKAAEFESKFKKMHGIDITLMNYKDLKTIIFDGWSGYHFVLESGLRVCPYCNRQYIAPVFSDNGRVKADLDHFLPKSKYPYFSMSLYNLVPACMPCNQSLKGQREFTFDHINPYVENLSDYFRFHANVMNYEISVEARGHRKNEIQYHLDTFKIEALYNHHQNQIKELLQKRLIYPETYIEDLFEANKSYFKDKNAVKQLIIGYIEEHNRLNEEAFLKLRRDIAEQLGFMKSDYNKLNIVKLSKILSKKKYSP